MPPARLKSLPGLFLLVTSALLSLPLGDRAARGATGDGEVVAWGLDSAGQATVPKEAHEGVSAISAGAFHSLALKGGQVLAWGQNSDGQTDVPEAARSGVSAVAAGSFFSLALKNGKVLGWGQNTSGQLKIPKEAEEGVTAIAAGETHSMALKHGRVLTWGSNLSGILKVPPEARSGVTAIAAGRWHCLALKGGRVIAWGTTRAPTDEPQKNPDGLKRDAAKVLPDEAHAGVFAISANVGGNLIIKNGKLFGWSYEPLTIPPEAAQGVSQAAVGSAHYLALIAGGVIAWGDGRSGQTRVPKEAKEGVIAISAGSGHSLALRVRQ